jgi:hypothetical protein
VGEQRGQKYMRTERVGQKKDRVTHVLAGGGGGEKGRTN